MYKNLFFILNFIKILIKIRVSVSQIQILDFIFLNFIFWFKFQYLVALAGQIFTFLIGRLIFRIFLSFLIICVLMKIIFLAHQQKLFLYSLNFFLALFFLFIKFQKSSINYFLFIFILLFISRIFSSYSLARKSSLISNIVKCFPASRPFF